METPPFVNLVDSSAMATSTPDSTISGDKPEQSETLPTTNKFEEYRQKVADTNIDSRSLLSTDYFNSFNSVVMVLDMLPDAPELLEEVEQWQFVDYVQHFRSSGLGFADLAIEVYPFSPPALREALEHKTNSIRILIEEIARTLRRLLDAGEKNAFANIAHTMAAQLRAMMEEGNCIVHGSATPTQAEIDKMF